MLYITLLNSLIVFSQDDKTILEDIRYEVEIINGQVLYKSIVDNCTRKLNSISSLNFEEIDGDLTCIYFDDENVVRKSIHLYNYPEYKGVTIHYYSSQKSVIYTINRACSALNPAVIGIVAINKKKSVYTDVQYNDDNDSVISIKEFWGADCLDTGNVVFEIKDVSDLENYCLMVFAEEDIYSKTKIKVSFDSPDKGMQSLVNVRLINLREDCSLDSKIIGKAGLGTNSYFVHILDKSKCINGVYWTKVKAADKESYMVSKFLEPIEKIIK